MLRLLLCVKCVNVNAKRSCDGRASSAVRENAELRCGSACDGMRPRAGPAGLAQELALLLVSVIMG